MRLNYTEKAFGTEINFDPQSAAVDSVKGQPNGTHLVVMIGRYAAFSNFHFNVKSSVKLNRKIDISRGFAMMGLDFCVIKAIVQ